MNLCHSCGAGVGDGLEAKTFVECDEGTEGDTGTVQALTGGTPHPKGGLWLDRPVELHGHYLCFRCMWLRPEERGKTPEEAYEKYRARFPEKPAPFWPQIDWADVQCAIAGIVMAVGVVGGCAWAFWHWLIH